MKIDDEEIWSVQVKKEDVASAIRQKVYEYMGTYAIRREDIKGIALGPNEFNALRLQMAQMQMFWDRRQDLHLPNATEFKFDDFYIYCAPRTGVQILLDGRWDIQIAEARKYLSLEGLDA